MILLTTWSHSLLFHRDSPNTIYVSGIIPNDPNDPALRISSGIPSSPYLDSIRPHWRLFKLVYASLLGADRAEVLSQCWKRKLPVTLSKGRKKNSEGAEGSSRKEKIGNTGSAESDPSRGEQDGTTASGRDVEEEGRDDGLGEDGEGFMMVGESACEEEADQSELRPPSFGEGDETDATDDGSLLISPRQSWGLPVSRLPSSLPYPSLTYSFPKGPSSVRVRMTAEMKTSPDAYISARHDLASRDWDAVKWESMTVPVGMAASHDHLDIESPSTDLDKRQTPDPVSVTELTFTTYLTHGRLYTVYRGSLTVPPSRFQPVIFKIVDLESMDDYAATSEDEGGYTSSQALHAVLNEVRLYTHTMAKLQGSVIPRFHGFFIGTYHPFRLGRKPVLIVALEDVGDITLDPETLSIHERYLSCYLPHPLLLRAE